MDLYDEIFSPSSGLARNQKNYKFRESQFEMALLIEKALKEEKHAVIEAGTGTGKSFAYLAPIFIELAKDKSRKAVIATSTITLEKQLYDKDIPEMKKALSSDIKAAILFGRKNYLCARKYKESLSARELISQDKESSYYRFDQWVKNTETGSRAEVPSKEIYDEMVKLSADENDCASFHCPCYDSCFFYNARKKAMSADLIVTNHHILLLDAKNRMECSISYTEDAVLPGYSIAVIDEAHHIEAEATDVLSSVYSYRLVTDVLNDLLKKQSRFGNATAFEALSAFEKADRRGFFRRAKADIAALREMAIDFEKLINPIIATLPGRDEVLFDSEFYSHYRQKLLEGEALAEALMKLSIDISTEYEEAKDNQAYEYILKKACDLQYYSDTLRSWIRFSSFDDRISFAEIAEADHYQLKIAPMKIGPVLSRVLLSQLSTLIYCSATLSVNNDFSYFAERSGLKEENERVLKGIYPSPFDYGHSLMFLLPQDGRAYSNEMAPQYHEYVTEAVSKAIEASGGGALVLFTSKAMLEEVYKNAKEKLPDYELLSQDGKTSKSMLLKRFKEDRDSSLFATSSFWEGVDAPGDTLRLLIIVKLPFQIPTAPILRARVDNMSRSGGNPFMSIYLPETTIKLKQGIGRLISSENDKGVVLILDNRILSKGYGRIMLSSLPQGYIPEDTMLENLPDKIERFLY